MYQYNKRMFLTSLYIRLKNWWENMTKPNVIDDRTLEKIIITTEVDMPSESETDHKPYNDYY